jgi:hypothetical protein
LAAAVFAAASVQAQEPPPAAPEGPAPAAAPVVEQVDPTEAIPLVAPSPPLAGPAYESRIRASLTAAQSFQGPLDGGWRLAGASGPLYDLQLVDRSGGAVEGAWRDLRRPGALTASGLVDAIDRDGEALRLRFDGGKVAVLRPGSGGAWAGELDGQAVTLARRAP